MTECCKGCQQVGVIAQTWLKNGKDSLLAAFRFSASAATDHLVSPAFVVWWVGAAADISPFGAAVAHL